MRLPLAGASATDLALAVGPVRNEIGRELMRRVVESVQEKIVERERLPRRAGRVNARRWSGADAPGRTSRAVGEHRLRELPVHVFHEAGMEAHAPTAQDVPRRDRLQGPQRPVHALRREVLTRPAILRRRGKEEAALGSRTRRGRGCESRDLRQDRRPRRTDHGRANPRRDHARRPEPLRGADPSGTIGSPISIGMI